jgi:hypothetical protein
VTLEINSLMHPAKPRPERLRRPSTESGLQALSGLFLMKKPILRCGIEDLGESARFLPLSLPSNVS